MFLNFGKFEPQCSHKHVSYKKKKCILALLKPCLRFSPEVAGYSYSMTSYFSSSSFTGSAVLSVGPFILWSVGWSLIARSTRLMAIVLVDIFCTFKKSDVYQ